MGRPWEAHRKVGIVWGSVSENWRDLRGWHGASSLCHLRCDVSLPSVRQICVGPQGQRPGNCHLRHQINR